MNVLSKAKEVTKIVGGFVKTNSPAILTGIGMAGTITTAILTGKATIKAMKIIEQEEKKAGGRIDTIDKVKKTWKCYIPAGISLVGSMASILAANKILSSRNAALAAGLTASTEALKAFKESANEVVGQETADHIESNAVRKRFGHTIPSDTSKLAVLGKPETLCLDTLTGQFFWSNPNDIKAAVNDFNAELVRTGILSANELLDFLNLKECELAAHNRFNIDDGTLSYRLDSDLADDLTPVLSIIWSDIPAWKYA